MKKSNISKCPQCHNQLINSQVFCNACNFLVQWPKGNLAIQINSPFFNNYFDEIYNSLFKPKLIYATELEAEEILRTRKQYIIGLISFLIWTFILIIFLTFSNTIIKFMNIFIISNFLLVFLIRTLNGIYVIRDAKEILRRNEKTYDWLHQKVVSEMGMPPIRVFGSKFTYHLLINILFAVFIIPILLGFSFSFIIIYIFTLLELAVYKRSEYPSIIYNENYIFFNCFKEVQYINWRDIESIEAEKIEEWGYDIDGHQSKFSHYNLKINLTSKRKPKDIYFRIERIKSLKLIKKILLFLSQYKKETSF